MADLTDVLVNRLTISSARCGASKVGKAIVDRVSLMSAELNHYEADLAIRFMKIVEEEVSYAQTWTEIV